MAVYDHVVKANRHWYKENTESPDEIDPSAYPSDDEGGGGGGGGDGALRYIELETS